MYWIQNSKARAYAYQFSATGLWPMDLPEIDTICSHYTLSCFIEEFRKWKGLEGKIYVCKEENEKDKCLKIDIVYLKVIFEGKYIKSTGQWGLHVI